MRRRCFPNGETTGRIISALRTLRFDFYAIVAYEFAAVHVTWLNGFVRRFQLDIYSEYQDFYCINIHIAFELIHRIHEYTQ